MKKFIILIPIFNDWKSLEKLLNEINNNINDSTNDKLIYGIIDPEENNLSLDMWAKSDGREIKDVFKRINFNNSSKQNLYYEVSYCKMDIWINL